MERQGVAARAAVIAGMGCGAAGLAAAGVLWGRPAGFHELWWSTDGLGGVSRIGLAGNELLVSASQLLLIGSWLALGALVQRGAVGLRTVIGGAVAGGVPLLLGAPLFSNDAYTYVALGELLDRGFNPYRVGWVALHQASYAGYLDRTWAHTPSPYSPVLLRFLELDAHLARGDLLGGVVLLRLIAMLAFVLLGWAVVRAVRSRPAAEAGTVRSGSSDPGTGLALWISVANPLMAAHLLSGEHIDVYIAVLVVLALTAHAHGHLMGAVLLVVLAAQVKVTAAAALPVLIADSLLADGLARGSIRGRAWARAGLLALGALATFSVLGLASGLGFGWIHGLSTPALGGNSMTPVNAVGDLLRRLGIFGIRPPNYHMTAAPLVAKAAGFAVAGAVICWAAVRVRRLGVPLAAAASFAAVSTFGTATWPWYFAPTVAAIAVSVPRWRVYASAAAGSVVLAVALKPGSAPAVPHIPVVGDVATLALLAGILILLSFPSLGVPSTSSSARSPGAPPFA